MGDVFIWRLFNQVAINPRVWGEKTDEAILKQTLEVDLPDVLDHLEAQLPAAGFLFGEVSIADVSIACFFRNAAFARYCRRCRRAGRSTAGFVERVLALPCFARLKPFEDNMIRTPIRAATRSAGRARRSAARRRPTEPPRRGAA